MKIKKKKSPQNLDFLASGEVNDLHRPLGHFASLPFLAWRTENTVGP